MSNSFETHLLIQQLQIKPYDFLETLPQVSDETILVFLSNLFMNGDMELFHSLILFLGQEHSDSDSCFLRILDILQQYHDDMYFYVLDKILPIILNYHISTQNPLFHLSILHLSNYEPLLTKGIQFIEHMDNLDSLLDLIRGIPKLHQPLIYSIYKYDPELAEFLHENIYRTVSIKDLTEEIQELNNEAKAGRKSFPQDLEELENTRGNNDLAPSNNYPEPDLNNNNNNPAPNSNHINNNLEPTNHGELAVMREETNNLVSDNNEPIENNEEIEEESEPNNLVSDNNDSVENNKEEELEPNNLVSDNNNNSLEDNANGNITENLPQVTNNNNEIDINEENSTKESEVLKSVNSELESLDNIPESMIDKSKGLIDQAVNDISNFGNIPHSEVQQEELEGDIDSQKEKEQLVPSNKKTLNTDLIKQVKDESLKQNTKDITADSYEEFVEQIPEEKLLLLSTFMRDVEKDAYLALARNKTYLKTVLKPSCDKLSTMINNPVAYHNKLGTNFKQIMLPEIQNVIRGPERKPILFFDAVNSIFCGKHSKTGIDICTHQNPYGDFFYQYETRKFNLKKQMYNLDIWLLLWDNIHYFNKVDNQKIGKLSDLYSIVFIVQPYILENMVSDLQDKCVNLYLKNGFTFISADDKITHELLNFYLFSKFYHEGDILVSGENYNWLHHGEGISINGKYSQIEEFLPFMISDMDSLTNILSQFYLNYNFLIHKLSLDVIKKKKYSLKKKRKYKKKKRQSKKK